MRRDKIKRMICLGDSNTWGYDPAVNGRFLEGVRWTSILQKKLEGGWRIAEEGMCGRTIGRYRGEEPFLSAREALPFLLRSQYPCDLVLIMLGTNDTKAEYDREPEQIAQELRGLIGEVRDEGLWKELESERPAVLTVSPAPLRELEKSPFFMEFGGESERKSRELSGWYLKAADETGSFFMDGGAVTAPGSFDGIHLDEEGHRRMALAVYDKIREMEVMRYV